MMGVYIAAHEQISCLGIGEIGAFASDERGLAWWEKFYPHAALQMDLNSLATETNNAVEWRQMDTLTRVTVACAGRAMKRVQAKVAKVEKEQMGIIVGSAFGCTASNQLFLDTLLRKGPRFVQPVVFRNTVSNAVAGYLAVAFKIMGSNSVLNSGMVSGMQAIAYAFEEIRAGHAKLILSGASDCVSEVIIKRHVSASRETGALKMPLVDGASIIVLCAGKAEHSNEWQLLGYSLGFLGTKEIFTGLSRLLSNAVKKAAIELGAVDAIALHTGTTAIWVKSDGKTTHLDDVIESLLRSSPPPPVQGNTAVQVTLALTDCLSSFSKGVAPGLFTSNAASLDRAPRCVIYICVADTGDMAALVLRSGYDAR